MKGLSLSIQKLWAILKFLTDKQTDRQTDKAKLYAPALDPSMRGHKNSDYMHKAGLFYVCDEKESKSENSS